MTVAELATKVEDVLEKLMEQKSYCSECSATVKTTLDNLSSDVGKLNRSLNDDNGGRSVHARLAVIESRMDRIERTNQIKLAHTITLIAALLGALGALAAIFFG
jgi:hypothetical protein